MDFQPTPYLTVQIPLGITSDLDGFHPLFAQKNNAPKNVFTRFGALPDERNGL